MTGISNGVAPTILNASYTFTAEVTVPEGGGDGMLITQGGRFAGYGFFVNKGKPSFTWNLVDLERITWEAPEPLSAGKHTLEFDFKYDGLGIGTLAFNDFSGIGRPGTGELKVDGAVVATKAMPHTIPLILAWDENMDIGSDTGTPVDDKAYQVPFAFTGSIDKLTLAVDRPELSDADKAKLEAATAGQGLGRLRRGRGGGSSAALLSGVGDRRVHRERQDHRVVEERADAVRQGRPAHGGGADHDVGDLGGHADDEGEVEEVPGAGVLGSGEVEAARLSAAGPGRVEEVGVVEGGQRVQGEPAERDAGHGEDAGGGIAGAHLAQEKEDRREAEARGGDGQRQDEGQALVGAGGALAQVRGVGLRHEEPGQDEVDEKEGVAGQHDAHGQVVPGGDRAHGQRGGEGDVEAAVAAEVHGDLAASGTRCTLPAEVRRAGAR